MQMIVMSLLVGGLWLGGALYGQQPGQQDQAFKPAEQVQPTLPETSQNQTSESTLTQELTGKELAVEKEGMSNALPSTEALKEDADEDSKKQQSPDLQEAEALEKESVADVESNHGKQEPVETQDLQDTEEMISIDTIDLDQPEGNWLTKRMWWERAKDKYKECRDTYEGIFASRMTFFEKRADIEKTILNPFYREIGLEQAQIRTVLMALIEDVEQEREESGFLDEKERDFLDKLIASKKDIEQLMLDIDTIDDIDSHIDKAINTLNGKINEAHRFEQSAWQEFEAIAHELSDKKAYERFYVIYGLHKNLKELKTYIDHEFTHYFNSLVQAAKDKTERAKKEMQELKDHGIDMKEQFDLLVVESQISDEEQAKIAEQKLAAAAQKAAQVPPSGFLGKAWGAIVGFFKAIWNLLFGWWLYKV